MTASDELRRAMWSRYYFDATITITKPTGEEVELRWSFYLTEREWEKLDSEIREVIGPPSRVTRTEPTTANDTGA